MYDSISDHAVLIEGSFKKIIILCALSKKYNICDNVKKGKKDIPSHHCPMNYFRLSKSMEVLVIYKTVLEI